MMDELKNYILSNPLNRLVISGKELGDLRYLDIGYELSLIISKLENYTPIVVYDSLMKLIEANVRNSAYDKYIALSNIGILFEPQLEFNVRHILYSLSRNYLLIINTEGEVDDSGIYFLTKRKGEKVDISGMSYFKIDK